MSDWWSADPVADRAPLRITVNPGGSKAPQSDWWASDPVASSVSGDVARSAGSGLVRGTASIAGVGGDINKGLAAGLDTLKERGVPVEQTRQDALAAMPSWLRKYHETQGPDVGSKAIMEGIDRATGLPVTSYEPKTMPGQFARTGGEFVAGAVLAPGGVVGNAIRYGVIPGLASEGAGQVAKRVAPQWEGAARLTGALGGAGVSALASRPGTASRAIREQLPEGVTPQMVDDAGRLIEQGAQQGITLSWPEALSQVAGRPVLTNTMRHLEAAPQTEARMAEFFGQRAQQVENAGRAAMDHVAPVNPQPSTIGPNAGRVADDALNTERQFINLATEADYAAAANVRLTPQEMTRVRALPGYDEARAAVRNDPQLNRYVANLPDDSVGFLNEVKKQLDQMGANARAPMAQNPNMQRAAGLELDASSVRDAGTRASPDYAIALTEQERLRGQVLEPLLQGPLGKLANRDQPTKAAIDALFPANPLPNSAAEIGQTVSTLARRSPRVASDLVRAHVESVFNEATQALQSGANQMGGAKFRSVLVGNPQQRANFEAAVRALPNGGERLAGFNRFLDVVEATGTRQNIGSRTAYNAELLTGQAASGVVGEASKAVANPIRGAQFLADKYERWRLGRNLNELAAILTDPRSANQLRAIARMPANSPQATSAALRIGQLGFSSTIDERAK